MPETGNGRTEGISVPAGAVPACVSGYAGAPVNRTAAAFRLSMQFWCKVGKKSHTKNFFFGIRIFFPKIFPID